MLCLKLTSYEISDSETGFMTMMKYAKRVSFSTLCDNYVHILSKYGWKKTIERLCATEIQGLVFHF